MKDKKIRLIFDKSKGYIRIDIEKKSTKSRIEVDTFTSNYNLKKDITEKILEIFKRHSEWWKKGSQYFSVSPTVIYSPYFLNEHFSKIWDEIFNILSDINNYEEIE